MAVVYLSCEMSAPAGPGWYYCCAAAVADPLQLVSTLPCCEGGRGGGEGRPVFNLTTIIILLQIQVLNMGGGNTARVPQNHHHNLTVVAGNTEKPQCAHGGPWWPCVLPAGTSQLGPAGAGGGAELPAGGLQPGHQSGLGVLHLSSPGSHSWGGPGQPIGGQHHIT